MLNYGLLSDKVISVAIDDKNNKWFGTDYGVAMFDDSNWHLHDSTNSGLPGNIVNSIVADTQGNTWFGTDAGGLARFDGTNWTVYNTSNSGIPHNNIRAITIDEEGNKWVGTQAAGVTRFDGTNWTVYNTSNSGLHDNGVYAIEIDKQGNTWFGTYRGGLSVYREGGVSDDVITSMAEWPERAPAKIKEDIMFSINPNPISNEGEISYTLNVDGYVRISISNILGINMFEIDKGLLPAGTFNQQMDSSILPQGSYFVTISLDGSAVTHKIMVIK